ncbi:MAG: sugar-binding protein [Candidatus Omnitrophota bacterium]|nr:sugar-binding protein [Candidatus Omnitrophota bacterium]
MRSASNTRPAVLAGLVLLAVAAVWWAFRPVETMVPGTGTVPGTAVSGTVVSAGGRPDSILVDDFETGQTQGIFGERKNRLDAFQGTWARRPSYTVMTKVLDTRPGSVGYALRMEYSKVGGWCGWYTLLNGIDVSKHNALTFWVKGEHGGERFDIGMADHEMQDMEIDAVYAGSILAFLPQGVTTQWQQVKIPLQGLRTSLDLARLGSLVLWFRYEGKGSIQIDDVAFAYDDEVEKIQIENTPRATADPESPRSMWIWKTDPINKLDARKELFSFSEKTAIRKYYIYLGEDPIPDTPAAYQKGLAEFLRECHERGIEVHALQGNPLWALKPYHSRVFSWIGGFLAFNRGRPVEERMDGIHMDIEPYLTQEWETGDREKLKGEFLELLAECRRMIDKQNEADGPIQRPWAAGITAAKPFVMGLAIPLFYTREPEMEEKLLKYLDYAGLMDYYDAAVDIIEQGRPHVELADQLGVEMMIGVETQDLVEMNQGKRRNTFIEEGWEEMEQELAKVTAAFKDSPSYGGIAIHYYDSYRLLQRGRNVPTRERTGKAPPLEASQRTAPVTVDGDLSDWADAPVWHKVDQKNQVVYGVGAWGWDKDMSFKVAVRWEPKALLLAVDVSDNSVVQEKRGADMWEGDHIELWVDADLEGDYNEAVNSADDFQIGLSPGNFKDLKPEVHVWVPSVDKDSIQEIELAAKPREGGYTLEARLPVSFLFQNVERRVGVEPTGSRVLKRITREQLALQSGVLASGELKPGFRLGIMLDGSDCDAAHQPQKCLLSTSPERQWGDPTTFNILELK